MEIIQIVGLGLTATLLVVILRPQKPEMALQLSLVVGVIIFIMMLSKIAGIIQVLEELSTRARINQFYLSTLLKIIGIAYIAEFGVQVCRDAGESSIAGRLEFAAKILVMVLALPIIAAVMESIIRLLP